MSKTTTNPNEKLIRVDDNVKNKDISIEYILNEPAKRLTRVLSENVRLVAEFFANPFGANGVSIYVVADEKSHCFESQKIKNKNLSREEYVNGGRPKIYSFATIAQILRITKDMKDLFENNKHFTVLKQGA